MESDTTYPTWPPSSTVTSPGVRITSAFVHRDIFLPVFGSPYVCSSNGASTRSAHVHPSSISQVSEHPSPAEVFPSSQNSFSSFQPSPHWTRDGIRYS